MRECERCGRWLSSSYHKKNCGGDKLIVREDSPQEQTNSEYNNSEEVITTEPEGVNSPQNIIEEKRVETPEDTSQDVCDDCGFEEFSHPVKIEYMDDNISDMSCNKFKPKDVCSFCRGDATHCSRCMIHKKSKEVDDAEIMIPDIESYKHMKKMGLLKEKKLR